MTTDGQYKFENIEKKWQDNWEKNKQFSVTEDPTKPKYYVLDMFPYPSGSGLHVGHVEGYTATDILARYKRMQGFNVLHPMGWDAFGLPAEQFAIKTTTHPKDTTQKNVDYYRQQIKGLGFSIDWDREVNTTDPDYYKWTQWIFLKLYERGLAYQSFEPVNWCPALGTVLANEEVIDGRSEVGDHPVIKKPLRQWVLKITEYAQRLLDDLEGLDWPESTKEMQKNWIGKSVGAEINFQVKDSPHSLTVFTTRADTIFGVSFLAIAPEHPLVMELTKEDQLEFVEDYLEETASKTELTRTSNQKDKTGVATGFYVLHPVTKEPIPIFVADYVLMQYGTGAVMGVPAHDERDHAFALKYELEIKQVLSSETDIEEAAFTGDGIMINSQFLNGLSKDQAIDSMCSWLEKNNCGKKSITFRLRDWIFSRQRYWGEPFPVVFDNEGNHHPLKESDLPVLLPEMGEYKPSDDGEPPLSRIKDWVQVTIDGKSYRRETNIMPQWAGSCWYYLRYLDPDNDVEAWGSHKEKYWMPVDLYVGGVEHANLHLLYARFWHKVLYDIGVVSTKEPFKKVIHQGLILGPNGEKMSKSRGNVINPDDVIKDFGADSLRMYEMFLGPLEHAKPWQTNGIAGIYRFLKRLWRAIIAEDGSLLPSSQEDSLETKKVLHKTIKIITEDTESLRFNTAISHMMEMLNYVYREKIQLTQQATESMVLMLAPYAPHIAEELWERLGHTESLTAAQWPVFDPQYIVQDTVTYAVMISGKSRTTIELPAGLTQAQVVAKVKELDAVQRYLDGQTIKREIFVPGKIVNFVL